MTRPLPPRASLEHLRNEAKSLLKVQKAGDPRACGTLRHLHRLAAKSDDEVLSTQLRLQECQHALAREYGFRCWADVKRHLESRAREEVERRQKWEEVLPGQVRPESLAAEKHGVEELGQAVAALG